MKRGFTLIELLAVIVILAIIALIATPIILGIINDAKEESKDRSVEIIIDSAQIFAANKELKDGLELDKNIYDEIVNEINGDRPDEGQVYINKHGEVALSLRYGDYCYTKSYGETKYYKEKTVGECITPFYYLKKATLIDEKQGEQPFFDGPVKRSEIEKIITESTNVVPEDVLGSWDVGVDKDDNSIKGKVMAWYKDDDNNGLYEVYIGQEGGVKGNVNSSNLFSYLINVKEIDLSNFDTSNVTNMYRLFFACKNILILDLSSFDTSDVTIMQQMFAGCNKLESLNLSNFDTSNVTSMYQMFNGCNSLTMLDVSNFDTSNVTHTEWMFNGCSSLTTLDVSNFDTKNVIYMGNMFSGCSSLTTLDVSNFNTAKAKSMGGMFNNCSKLTSLDLSSFDTSSATTMINFFSGSRNLKNILVGKAWTTENANTENMFKDCGTDHVTVK